MFLPAKTDFLVVGALSSGCILMSCCSSNNWSPGYKLQAVCLQVGFHIWAQ